MLHHGQPVRQQPIRMKAHRDHGPVEQPVRPRRREQPTHVRERAVVESGHFAARVPVASNTISSEPSTSRYTMKMLYVCPAMYLNSHATAA